MITIREQEYLIKIENEKFRMKQKILISSDNPNLQKIIEEVLKQKEDFLKSITIGTDEIFKKGGI